MKRWTRKAIDLREKLSQRVMIISLVVFVISLLIFNASNNSVWIAFTGFLMVIFGSIIVLFVLTFLIFWFLERMLYKRKMKSKTISFNENKSVSKKKVSKKKTSSKRSVSKKKTARKPVKKKVSKKKAVKKPTKKKISKKKAK